MSGELPPASPGSGRPIQRRFAVGERVTVIYRDSLQETWIIHGVFVSHLDGILVVKGDGRRCASIIKDRDLISLARCSQTAPAL